MTLMLLLAFLLLFRGTYSYRSRRVNIVSDSITKWPSMNRINDLIFNKEHIIASGIKKTFLLLNLLCTIHLSPCAFAYEGNSEEYLIQEQQMTSDLFADRNIKTVENLHGMNPKTAALIPIVGIYDDIKFILNSLTSLKSESLSNDVSSSLKQLFALLSQPKYDKTIFKKIFNTYSDGIYYSDPNRVNAYLGGKAMPGTIQTQQYMYRNEALTSIENLKQDIELMITAKQIQSIDYDDAVDDGNRAVSALNSYFGLADPADLNAVRGSINQK